MTINISPLDRLSFIHLVLLVLPWSGLGIIFAIGLGITTPVLEMYGLSPSLASLVWIIGPISGLFTAPIVGALSDKCTSNYGRRRPFIVFGLVMTVIASSVLSFTYAMNELKIVIYLISFLLIVVSLNISQITLGAFNADLVPDTQQAVIQLLSVVAMGTGGILGLGLMALLWTGTNPSELPKLMGAASLISSVLVILPCVFVKEVPLDRLKSNIGIKIGFKWETVLNHIRSLDDTTLRLVCAIQFLSWIALYAWSTSASTWFGRNVYSGCVASDSNCTSSGLELYQQGTNAFSVSGIYKGGITLALALIFAVYFQANTHKKVRLPYAIGLLVGSAAMILAKFGPLSPGFAFGIAICMGVPTKVACSFPFAVVGRIHAQSTHSNVGRDFGTINLFMCLAQLLVAFVTSGFRAWLGNDGLPWVLFLAGVALALAASLVLFLNEDGETSVTKEGN